MKKIVITGDNVPKAIGPYSVAIQIGDFIFTSGQLGVNPVTGDLVAGGITAETRQSLINLRNVLNAADSGLEWVVKIIVFLKDIADFSSMNTIYAEFFTEEPPARSAIQVAALPKGASIEIEAIAIRK